jgi:hypothetical protein
MNKVESSPEQAKRPPVVFLDQPFRPFTEDDCVDLVTNTSGLAPTGLIIVRKKFYLDGVGEVKISCFLEHGDSYMSALFNDNDSGPHFDPDFNHFLMPFGQAQAVIKTGVDGKPVAYPPPRLDISASNPEGLDGLSCSITFPSYSEIALSGTDGYTADDEIIIYRFRRPEDPEDMASAVYLPMDPAILSDLTVTFLTGTEIV